VGGILNAGEKGKKVSICPLMVVVKKLNKYYGGLYFEAKIVPTLIAATKRNHHYLIYDS
jgi:hypothetical protein